MPKMKTHRGAAKRFKRTATGKFKRRRAWYSHYQTHKTASSKRKGRKTAMVSKSDHERVQKMLG